MFSGRGSYVFFGGENLIQDTNGSKSSRGAGGKMKGKKA